MALSNVSPSDTKVGDGHGGPPPPAFRGGGDGRGDGSPNYGERLRRARLGLAVALAPVVTLFLSFTVVYVVRQGWLFSDGGPTLLHPPALPLPLGLFELNTFLILASTLTMELARRAIIRKAALAPVMSIPGVSLGKERDLPWLELTTLLGIGFLVGQLWAWRVLAARGFYVSTNSSSTFVYLLTGMHGVHLAGGLVALLFAVIGAARGRVLESQRIMVDVVAWYWHFMGALWLYIFALLLLAR